MSSQPTPLRLLAAITAVIAGLVLRQLSIAPLAGFPSDRAMLRLSWSARPERVEQCRRLTDDELAERPAHMQMRYECEGHFARYLLSVLVGDRVIARDTLRGGGFRNDRPIHVFAEFPVTPGAHRVRVDITRLDTVAPLPLEDVTEHGARETGSAVRTAERDAREAAERARRAEEALPPRATLDSMVTISSRRVLLVTYEPEAHRFVFRSSP